MRLYTLNTNGLTGLKEKPFKLERDIQNVAETNLETIFGYRLLSLSLLLKTTELIH